MLFEWDEEKATGNANKHGVAFTEAGTIFGDEQSITIPDLKHSQKEPRFITMGMSQHARLLIVIHTERGNHLRIISARPASRKERNQYEKVQS
ncbi:MAG: BrnT family toxin [Proteobacteria bacterium]|nr:BrnT family toxin [Pseudomonadota bacterium]